MHWGCCNSITPCWQLGGHKATAGMTQAGITSGRKNCLFPLLALVASQTNAGEKRGNAPLVLSPRRVGFEYSLLLFFFLIQLVTISSTILHFFLAFTTQKEAALWVKLVQKVLYVLEPACTLHQLLQNIGHNK